MGTAMSEDYNPYDGADARYGWLCLVALVLMLTMCSCGSVKYVPVETVRMDSIKVTLVQKDSVHVRDSVYIVQRADTVFREHWNTVYKEIVRSDTAYIERKDTISVPYPVEQRLTTWQKVKVSFNVLLFVVGCLGVIAAVVWLIRKKIIHT